MLNAFLIGSRKYGAPGNQSDTDIAVLMEDQDFHLLSGLHGEGDQEGSSNPYSTSIRIGPVNLLVFKCPLRFAAWKEATDELYLQRPVTREQAIAKIKLKVKEKVG